MKSAPLTADQWKETHALRLIDCRWGCKITPEACHAYQTRTSRYIIHFNGEIEPFPRMNADYVTCFLPEPCPHLMSDEDVRAHADRGRASNRERRLAVQKNRLRQQLADPNVMLMEQDWRRLLVSR